MVRGYQVRDRGEKCYDVLLYRRKIMEYNNAVHISERLEERSLSIYAIKKQQIFKETDMMTLF